MKTIYKKVESLSLSDEIVISADCVNNILSSLDVCIDQNNLNDNDYDNIANVLHKIITMLGGNAKIKTIFSIRLIRYLQYYYKIRFHQMMNFKTLKTLEYLQLNCHRYAMN